LQERQLLISRGIKVIEFRDSERESYLETAYRAGWEKVTAKSPVIGGVSGNMMER
jgi:hypothetical protein